MSQIYTHSQLAQHRTFEDCWILIHGKVYDVTRFLDKHPGGDDVIAVVAGKDATKDFEDTGHSDEAKEIMKDYYIGEIDKSSAPAPVPSEVRQSIVTEDKSSNSCIKFLQFFVPAVILGLILAVYKLETS